MDQTDWKGESVSGCINLESMCLDLNRIIETQLLFARCVPCVIAPFGILPTLLVVYVRLNGGAVLRQTYGQSYRPCDGMRRIHRRTANHNS